MAIITGICKCTYVISLGPNFTIILVHISTCTCTVCTVLNEYLDASQCRVQNGMKFGQTKSNSSL